MARFQVFSCGLATIVLVVATAFGQYTNATIHGTVYDSAGAVVAGANVTVQSLTTGYAKTVQSGSDGTFLFPATPVGQFQVAVE